METIIADKLNFDEDTGIWYLHKDHYFNYSDGLATEIYLSKVYNHVSDLSSSSSELESFIRDWPTKYHLSSKRAQLLKNFNFRHESRVLEVGCGCGAITRYLGEIFKKVIAVEGSKTRAQLARLRCSDLHNVQIINAPFQDIKFKQKFDIIFCIGVFEYAGSFIKSSTPFHDMLRNFHQLLTENGLLIIAIENKFGLKYFAGLPEDHTAVSFDGIEGYPRFGSKTITFGYNELKTLLSNFFSYNVFYYPLPDYKLVDCILTEEFLLSVDAGELIGNFGYEKHPSLTKPLFDERLAWLEISKNKNCHLFAPSFLILSHKSSEHINKSSLASFDGLGVIFNTNRQKKFQTITRFVSNGDKLIVKKGLASGRQKETEGDLTCTACKGSWYPSYSIQMLLLKKVKRRDLSLKEIFSEAILWVNHLQKISFRELNAEGAFLPGNYIDRIWRNSFIKDKRVVFIDNEWIFAHPLSLNALIIRAIYDFILEMQELRDITPSLRDKNIKRLITTIAKVLNVDLNRKDFQEFIHIQSYFHAKANGYKIERFKLIWKLYFTSSFKFCKTMKELFIFYNRAILNKIYEFTPFSQRLSNTFKK